MGAYARQRLHARIKVVVHAHPTLFRETLTRALSVSGCVVQATTRDALMASALVSQLSPEVCILDADEGSATCLEAARRLRERAPAVKVLVLSSGPSPTLNHAFHHRLVDAVVDRSCVFGQLEAALMRTVRGDPCRAEGSGTSQADPRATTVLTTREHEVLERLARGATTFAIAQELNISPHTVRTHVQGLMRKLDVHGRGRAVSVALARNLLEVRSA